MKKEVILLFVFSCVSVFGILHHEIWLDEAHHWLFARDSETIQALWDNMRYDGHPILWNLALFVITRFSQEVVYMQILNVCISITAVAVFLFFSPFRFFEKALFTSGYFILYEYTMISRNYALFMLFLFLTIVLYRKKSYGLLGLVLALLANTHLFGLAIASFFVGMAGFEIISERKERMGKRVAIGFLIFVFGAVISLCQIIPPSDSKFLNTHAQSPALERMARTSGVFLKGLIAIPDFTNYHFWNSNLLMSISKPICAVLSVILFCIPLLLFRNRFPLLLFFYSSAVFLVVFFYLSDLNAVRYYGVIYLILVSCIWLSRAPAPLYVPSILKRLKFKRDYSQQFFIALLFIQAIAGIPSYTLDLIRPFSESKNAANLMLHHKEVKDCISIGCGAASISAYLGKKVYYLNTQSYGSFCKFNRSANFDSIDQEQLKKGAVEFIKKTHRSAFLISNMPLTLSPLDSQYIKPVDAFERSVLRYENYYIYSVSMDGGS